MGTSDIPLLRAGAAVDAARGELVKLVDRHLPAAQSACATARASFRWIERVLERARAAAFEMPHYETRSALLLQVTTLEIEIESLRPQVSELAQVREVLR